MTEAIEQTKIGERLSQLAKIAHDAVKAGATEQSVLSLIADCRNGLVRTQNRARTQPGMDRFEIAQTHGPLLEFTGRLLAETTFTTERADPLRISFEIYETAAGVLVAVSSTEPVERDGFEVVRATVVERQDDAQAMRFAVMEHFEFHPWARNMAKKLGWSLRLEVA
jgi:hypothetical protein